MDVCVPVHVNAQRRQTHRHGMPAACSCAIPHACLPTQRIYKHADSLRSCVFTSANDNTVCVVLRVSCVYCRTCKARACSEVESACNCCWSTVHNRHTVECSTALSVSIFPIFCSSVPMSFTHIKMCAFVRNDSSPPGSSILVQNGEKIRFSVKRRRIASFEGFLERLRRIQCADKSTTLLSVLFLQKSLATLCAHGCVLLGDTTL